VLRAWLLIGLDDHPHPRHRHISAGVAEAVRVVEPHRSTESGIQQPAQLADDGDEQGAL